jgi:hypothetical protein
METQHLLRKYVNRWERDTCALAKAVAECESTISTLKAELKHARRMHSTHRKVIRQMQQDMALGGIPIRRVMMSVSNCRASDDEVCPLSHKPINQSPLPWTASEPCVHVLNPMRPERKCAELACGHRFNSMWLMDHFVRHNTFRCPVCQSGEESFRFRHRELPPGVLRMIEAVKQNAAPP